jgi:hypothetical protein
MFSDGINNSFEQAHQTGLTRGFDLGWSYKGKFDRVLLREYADKYPHGSNKRKIALELIELLEHNKNNHEFITN